MSSAHYYLHAFLQRSNKAKWNKKVKFFFDNGTIDLPFDEWLDANAEVFEPLVVPAIELRSADDFETTYLADDSVCILLLKGYTRAQTMTAVEAILNERMPVKDGRQKFAEEQKTWFTFASKPDVESLEKMLRLHDLMKAETDLYNYQYVERLAEVGVDLAKDDGVKWSNKLDEGVKRRVMTATVSRYKRWTETLLRNLEKGVFPRHG